MFRLGFLTLMALFFLPAFEAQAAKPRPVGYTAFCLASPSFCETDRVKFDDTRPYQTQKGTLGLLQEINNKWNGKIQAVADPNGSEQWTASVTEGDCEEFAMAKRRDLLKRGFNASQVLLVRVLDSNNEGHLITAVRLSTGVYILDNLRSDVVTFKASGYKMTGRQREDLPFEWTTKRL